MRFTKVQCECCKNEFAENDDVVVCPLCGSPHHRDCYNRNGDCINKDKHSLGFVWEFPEELKPKAPDFKRHNKLRELEYKFKNGESAVVCPHCGTPNYGNDALCAKCRKPLTADKEEMEASDKKFRDDNERTSYYNRFGGLRPDILIEGIPAGDITEYVGAAHSGSYIRKFIGMERFGRKFSFSICAFLFGPFWFLYRKLYKEGLIYLLILLILTGVQLLPVALSPYYTAFYKAYAEQVKESTDELIAAYENKDITQEEFNVIFNTELDKLKNFSVEVEGADTTAFQQALSVIPSVASILVYALRFAGGFLGDFFYKKKIFRDIKRLKGIYGNGKQYISALKKKGGTSIPGIFLALICQLVISSISSLPMLIAGFGVFFGG